MNKQLKNIFVPLEVAKLAHEKGFKEWCAAIISKHGNIVVGNTCQSSSFNFNHFVDSNHIDCDCYNLPTHLQLIMWLIENHEIEVQLQMNGLFKVFDYRTNDVVEGSDCTEFEINEALEHALNLLTSHA